MFAVVFYVTLKIIVKFLREITFLLNTAIYIILKMLFKGINWTIIKILLVYKIKYLVIILSIIVPHRPCYCSQFTMNNENISLVWWKTSNQHQQYFERPVFHIFNLALIIIFILHCAFKHICTIILWQMMSLSSVASEFTAA